MLYEPPSCVACPVFCLFVFACVFIPCVVPVIGRELVLDFLLMHAILKFLEEGNSLCANLCLCSLSNSILWVPHGIPHSRFPYVIPWPEAREEMRSLLKSRGSWIHLGEVFSCSAGYGAEQKKSQPFCHSFCLLFLSPIAAPKLVTSRSKTTFTEIEEKWKLTPWGGVSLDGDWKCLTLKSEQGQGRTSDDALLQIKIVY